MNETKREKIDYAGVLDFLVLGFKIFSRRDCGLILAGYRSLPHQRHADQMLNRLARQGLVEQRGRGAHARFTITAQGRRRAVTLNPRAAWDQAWDGRWHVVSYDLPESRRKDRFALWQALRDRKLGLLQRSVWVWPHDVEPMLMEVIQAQGVPECFCGFEATRLFLCCHAEVVQTAWDFEEIGRRHQRYLQHLVAEPGGLRKAGSLMQLARLARIERQAYAHAFSLDPLLPRTLWPKNYQGPAVVERHEQFRALLQRRIRTLSRA